jgi:hypothetical protein
MMFRTQEVSGMEYIARMSRHHTITVMISDLFAIFVDLLHLSPRFCALLNHENGGAAKRWATRFRLAAHPPGYSYFESMKVVE